MSTRPLDLDVLALVDDPLARYALALEAEIELRHAKTRTFDLDTKHELLRFELSVTGRLLWVSRPGDKKLAAVRTRLGWDISALVVPVEYINVALHHLQKEAADG